MSDLNLEGLSDKATDDELSAASAAAWAAWDAARDAASAAAWDAAWDVELAEQQKILGEIRQEQPR